MKLVVTAEETKREASALRSELRNLQVFIELYMQVKPHVEGVTLDDVNDQMEKSIAKAVDICYGINAITEDINSIKNIM